MHADPRPRAPTVSPFPLNCSDLRISLKSAAVPASPIPDATEPHTQAPARYETFTIHLGKSHAAAEGFGVGRAGRPRAKRFGRSTRRGRPRRRQGQVRRESLMLPAAVNPSRD